MIRRQKRNLRKRRKPIRFCPTRRNVRRMTVSGIPVRAGKASVSIRRVFQISKTFSICSGSVICSADVAAEREAVRRHSAARICATIWKSRSKKLRTGKEQKLQIPRLEKCDVCEGKGTEEGTAPETCITCEGSGQTRYQQGFFSVMRTCPNCSGKGQIIKNPCKNCRGAGRIEKEKTIEIKIPAGVETGSRLRIMSEGEAGLNGGPTGDLYIVIHVAEHEMFERQGVNLYASVPVSFAQAALGAEIEVKTLEGEQSLKIPAGTQTGTVFRLKEQGMPNLGGRGKGDLFVAVTLVTPKNLTKEQRKILEQLAEIEDVDFEDQSFIDKVRNIFG